MAGIVLWALEVTILEPDLQVGQISKEPSVHGKEFTVHNTSLVYDLWMRSSKLLTCG